MMGDRGREDRHEHFYVLYPVGSDEYRQYRRGEGRGEGKRANRYSSLGRSPGSREGRCETYLSSLRGDVKWSDLLVTRLLIERRYPGSFSFTSVTSPVLILSLNLLWRVINTKYSQEYYCIQHKCH